jgi:hypothetical protein
MPKVTRKKTASRGAIGFLPKKLVLNGYIYFFLVAALMQQINIFSFIQYKFEDYFTGVEAGSCHSCVTLFSMPKLTKSSLPYETMALESWRAMKPKPQIVLYGDENEICTKLDCSDLLVHPFPGLSPFGTPYLHTVFDHAHATYGSNTLYVYVNADILLPENFTSLILSAAKVCRRHGTKRLLMAGERYNVPSSIIKPCFTDDCMQEMKSYGKSEGYWGVDYLVHTANTWERGTIPPFLVGRFAWDNWLMHSVITDDRAVTIDLSESVTGLHPIHDYSHAPSNLFAEERSYNLQLARDDWKLGRIDRMSLIMEKLTVLDDFSYYLKPRKSVVIAMGQKFPFAKMKKIRIF